MGSTHCERCMRPKFQFEHDLAKASVGHCWADGFQKGKGRWERLVWVVDCRDEEIRLLKEKLHGHR